MRIVRQRTELCGMCSDGDRAIGEHPCRSVAAIETRILLNRAETKALGAVHWVRERWFEDVVYRALRARCVLFGRHSAVCGGRADHRRPA
jgi:hypothetical protein